MTKHTRNLLKFVDGSHEFNLLHAVFDLILKVDNFMALKKKDIKCKNFKVVKI